MKADLHVHTDISDSSCNLEDTLKYAKANGVTHLGIVNHDTVEGLKEAIDQGVKLGIKVIPGVEISAYHSQSGKKVHILGYNFNLEAENIKNLCEIILERRHENSLHQIKALIDNDYNISPNNIYNRAKNSLVIYKQHIMAELVERGYTESIYSDMYTRLFRNNGICAMDIEYVDVFEAVRAIKADNGIAILAHPGQLDSYNLIDSLVEVGLDGIELNHEDHTVEDLKKIKAYRDKHQLILTGGSDFHGEYGKQKKIGGIISPDEYLYIFDENIVKNEINAKEIISFAAALAKSAGKHLKELRRDNLCLRYKNNEYRDIVTKYDVEIESFLIKKINEKYPEHSFITEEKSCEDQCFKKYTWIIDPIDGTANFVSIGREFAISIALYKDKKPFIGVVYDVFKDELYYAISGGGAFLNDMPLKKLKSNCTLKESLIDMSLNTINIFYEVKGANILKLIKEIRGHRAYGAASLSICKIALGELQAYISAKLNLWDYAAAIIILKEVGGTYECFDAVEEEYSPNPVMFIAGENETILKEVWGTIAN